MCFYNEPNADAGGFFSDSRNKSRISDAEAAAKAAEDALWRRGKHAIVKKAQGSVDRGYFSKALFSGNTVSKASLNLCASISKDTGSSGSFRQMN